MTTGPTPTRALLADSDVKRWYENVGRGSRATADVNLARLAAVCRSRQTTPQELIRMDEKRLHEFFLDFVATEERRGRAGSYIVRSIKGVRSWLAHNGVLVKRPLKVRGSQATPTLRDERTPTPEELRAILLAADQRTRVAGALIAFGGLRPEVLGNYLGTDGLRLRDFPELSIARRRVRFEKTPTVVRVREDLSKTGHSYLTFLGAEGCEYLRGYLEERLRAGEKLDPESDVISPARARKRFIRTINIGDAVRGAIRAAGFRWRPYVLRAYFDTRVMLAESKGKVARDYRVFWMGHVGSIDARYTTNKGCLPRDVVEDMRGAYKRCEPYLSTVVTREDRSETDIETRRLLLLAVGYSEQQVDGMHVPEMETAALVEAIRKSPARTGAARAPHQMLVQEGQLSRYLDEGWIARMPVNGSKFIVERAT